MVWIGWICCIGTPRVHPAKTAPARLAHAYAAHRATSLDRRPLEGRGSRRARRPRDRRPTPPATQGARRTRACCPCLAVGCCPANAAHWHQEILRLRDRPALPRAQETPSSVPLYNTVRHTGPSNRTPPSHTSLAAAAGEGSWLVCALLRRRYCRSLRAGACAAVRAGHRWLVFHPARRGEGTTVLSSVYFPVTRLVPPPRERACPTPSPPGL